MTAFFLQIPGQPGRTIGPEQPSLSVGRSPQNDWVLEDATLSRQHARFEWDAAGLAVVDLGSRFGISLNGLAIQGRAAVAPGDELILGDLKVEVRAVAAPSVQIDAEPGAALALTTLAVPAARLRSNATAGPEADRGARVLAFVQAMTLGLIRDVPVQRLLEDLLEQLLDFLEAERGAVLLKDAQGAVRPEVVRVRGGPRSSPQIRLSRTLVEAALDRREAVLLSDPLSDPQLASRSLILSGITTAILTPLEAEGQVTGLLYFDSSSLLKQFTREDLQLATTLAHVAAAKVQGARLQAEAQKTRTLEHEMGIARSIQQRMLPLAPAADGPFDLAAELRPAREVGGDLYDYQWRGGRLCFCIGDVSGKGVPAALVMALTKTLFRADGAFLDDPARLMAAVNAMIYEETGPAIFVTAFCGFFDPADGRLVYSNAGHEPPVRLAPGRPPRFLDTCSGLGLGILPEFVFTTEEARLGLGEVLLLYTDGVTEALNPLGGQFTGARLLAELAGCPSLAPAEVLHRVTAAVDRFADGAPPADDLTLMCLRHRAPGHPDEHR